MYGRPKPKAAAQKKCSPGALGSWIVSSDTTPGRSKLPQFRFQIDELETSQADVHPAPGHPGSHICNPGPMALTERGLTIPELMLIAGTRVALGAGLGLLLSDRLNKDQRRAAGWALLGVGVLTTIPILRGVFAKERLRP